MSTNTGGQAFPGPHWSEGETGMTLLDWMAGQALKGLLSNPDPMPWDKVHPVAYMHASAMLAEKARREADHSGDANKMVQGPTAANNERWARFQAGIRIAFSPTGGWLAEIRDGSMGYGDSIADAIANLRARWEEKNVVPNLSPDAWKMAALEAANRELVEALVETAKMLKEWHLDFSHEVGDKEKCAVENVDAIIAKHKGAE